jgi:hypothetical protein
VQGYDAGLIVVVLWEQLRCCCDLAVRAVAVQKESERGPVTVASELKPLKQSSLKHDGPLRISAEVATIDLL